MSQESRGLHAEMGDMVFNLACAAVERSHFSATLSELFLD